MNIRRAAAEDLSRIAEIYVFNNRMNFYPIFKDEGFSFGKMQVVSLADDFKNIIDSIYVFNDGVVKGFIQMNETEIVKLYVDTFFQSSGIGGRLIEYAVKEFHADGLSVGAGKKQQSYHILSKTWFSINRREEI